MQILVVGAVFLIIMSIVTFVRLAKKAGPLLTLLAIVVGLIIAYAVITSIIAPFMDAVL